MCAGTNPGGSLSAWAGTGGSGAPRRKQPGGEGGEVAGRPIRPTPAGGAEITIRKTIPVAGGMAGGSADAAGALLACSVLWDLDTGPDDPARLGAKLGADVPFQLMGGTAFGTGRGDQLMPVLSRGSYHWVLALSGRAVHTRGVPALRRVQPGCPRPTAQRGDERPGGRGRGGGSARRWSTTWEPAAASMRPGCGGCWRPGVGNWAHWGRSCPGPARPAPSWPPTRRPRSTCAWR